MKIRHIQTKFVLIVSVLMALVMALQLYFTSRTQSDVINELTRLEKKINTVTDQLVTSTFNERVPAPPSVILSRDSLSKKTGVFIGSGKTILSPKAESRARFEWNLSDSLRSTVHVREIWQKGDSNRQGYSYFTRDSFETVVVDLNAPRTGRTGVNIPPPPPPGTRGNFSFVFPGLANDDDAPKLLRYNYSAGELQEALDDARDRNLIITLLLFGFSIIGIVLIAGSLTKPVKELNHSFDRVVNGELNVRVEPRRDDEMGELARSFNHMVSELKKNREKEELLHRQERLAALGQLAAGVAHEIKNPLNAINLTIEHLRDRFVDANDTRTIEYVGTVQNEIRRLDETVNNFLSYVRSENLQTKKQDVVPLIRETLQLYEREMKLHGIELQSDLKPLQLDVDADRFKTVIMNLVLNAIQAMPKGGLLQVKTTPDKKIIIQDNGAGIAAKNLEHIFDLFYTTKSGGTGLGLPTAYKIVEAHGGHLKIESTENEGTTLLIDFSGKDAAS